MIEKIGIFGRTGVDEGSPMSDCLFVHFFLLHNTILYQKQCKHVYKKIVTKTKKYSTIVFIIMASKRCKQVFFVTAQYLYLLPATVDNYYKKQNYNIKEYCFN